MNIPTWLHRNTTLRRRYPQSTPQNISSNNSTSIFMRRDWYGTVPSFLPAEWGVGVGIASVVQCPVCTVYSVLYCTVPVFLRTLLLTHTSAVSVGPTAARFTPRCYNIQLLLQWVKQLVTLTTSENNKYVNYHDFVTCGNVVNLNHKKVGNLIVYLFKVSPKLHWKEIHPQIFSLLEV